MLTVFVLMGVMFWNVENFLDYDGGKCALVGKTVLWAGAPEVVGLAEVGNAKIVRALCRSDVLRKFGYRYVHYDSPDKRGIDVALLYDADSLTLVKSYPIPLHGLRTRDILYVCLRDKRGQLWHFYVNHHPSKYGGASSGEKRVLAMRTLACSVDSLIVRGERRIIAMGDFNDTPDAEAFRLIEKNLCNLGAGILESESWQTGTIRYRGKWELIDNFLVSGSIDSTATMRILRPDFLMEKDKSFPGLKPKRTYIGPRYNGGVSDHLPIIVNTRTK